MSGGEIYDNATTSGGGGGVFVHSWSKFTMSGGKIYNNRRSYNFTNFVGGGVHIGTFSEFIMSGGEIYGNEVITSTANNYGAGVLLSVSVNFKKTGGIIYGYDPDDPDNPKSNKVIKGGVVQTDKGSSVHQNYDINNPSKRREATSFAADNMDSTISGPNGGWL